MSQRVISCLNACCLGLVFVTLFPAAVLAQEPKSVITIPVDETQLVTLTGNIPSATLDSRNDRGRVDDALTLDHMLLLLKRTPENEALLESLIDAMHDTDSPEYHHWLTAQQLGARFGVAPHDTGILREWLESHGFTVNLVHQNGLMIDFSGTAGQVRETFHTEIHNLILANGDKHIANVSDPQIPAALAPAVDGIASLHDFSPARISSTAAQSATIARIRNGIHISRYQLRTAPSMW
jgi:hypothetical protein